MSIDHPLNPGTRVSVGTEEGVITEVSFAHAAGDSRAHYAYRVRLGQGYSATVDQWWVVPFPPENSHE